MACIPNSHDFTPCQLAQLNLLHTEEARRKFAASIGLSHALDRLNSQAAKLNSGVQSVANLVPRL